MSAKKNRDENANATQPKKRPRGRPRKNPIPESIKVVEESVEKKQNLPQIEKLREAGVPNLTILKKELPSTENEINSWREELSNEINRLEGELKIVDKEYRESKKTLKSIELERQKIMKLRDKINLQIRKDQNIIFKAEKALQTISENFYSADMPDFLRMILKFVPFYKDEISLKTTIAKNEAKISQRKRRAVDINGNLAKTMVAYKSYQNSAQIIEAMSESYRIARTNLGKIQREFDSKYQASATQAEQNEIVSNYRETIEKLNLVKTEFEDSALETKTTTETAFNSITNQYTNIENILNDQTDQ